MQMLINRSNLKIILKIQIQIVVNLIFDYKNYNKKFIIIKNNSSNLKYKLILSRYFKYFFRRLEFIINVKLFKVDDIS